MCYHPCFLMAQDMSDIFFSPSKAYDDHGSPLYSPVRTSRFPPTSITPESYKESHRESVGGEAEINHSTSSNLGGLGTKYARDFDSNEKKQHPASGCSAINESVSSITVCAKKLRINDNVFKDRDPATCHLQSKQLEARGNSIPGHLPLNHRILATPSFAGLPEELVLEIVFYLDIFDILKLRKTNRRLCLITRARIIWITHLTSLLKQVKLPKNTATVLDSLLSTPAIEHIVKRPHAFAHKWFYSHNFQQNPSYSRALSVIWDVPQNFRLPTLLPGGRWLIAVCYHQHPLRCDRVCLWDLEQGKFGGLPEAQMTVAGVVSCVDIKMDRSGSFAFMAVLSSRVNVSVNLVYRIDIYQIRFFPDSFGFLHVDTLSLNDRRAHEVRIYPDQGHVILDLFDRVLIWAYSPMNKCAWILTSINRHRCRRFTHRAAHAITWTHEYLLVADGDESTLRGFNCPPLSNRPRQLSALGLYISDPSFELPLPHFATSLCFTANPLVDISRLLERQASTLRQLPRGILNLPSVFPTHLLTTTAVENEDALLMRPEPCSRVVLFVDAAASDSYTFCNFPPHEISQNSGSPDTLLFTTMTREHAHEQTRRGAQGNRSSTDRATHISTSRPFETSPLAFGCHFRETQSTGNALWTGNIDEISPSSSTHSGEPKARRRTVVLMRDPENPGGLAILSIVKPPQADVIDLVSGQAVINEVEQGEARVVLRRLGRDIQAGLQTRIEEASVDSISGRVCIVERTLDPEAPATLRLLEYA